ncbi:neprilysin-1-like [Haemaphysalis longicornis]
MYNACLGLDDKEDDTAGIRNVMAQFGLDRWPLTCEKGCRDAHLNWSQVLLKAGIYHVLQISVGKDIKRKFSHVLQMDQPSFGAVGRNQLIYPNKEENQAIISAYKNAIMTAIQFFNPNITGPQAKELADTIVRFQGELANLTTPPEERRDVLGLYHRMEVRELQANFSDFPLLQALKREFKKIKVKLNKSETLEVYGLPYYQKLVPFLQRANSTTLFNYVGMNAMLYWGQCASRNIRNATLDFNKANTGVKEDIPMWEKCVGLASQGMPHVIGYLYVKNKFSQEAKQEVEDIVKKLKEVFNETIMNATWMDNETKLEADKKLTKMRSKVGYPEWIMDVQHLQWQYKDVPQLNRSASLLSIWKSVRDNNWMREMERLRMKYHPENEWIVGPTVVDAFYNPPANEMVYPSAILQGPLYEHGLPRSINFGAIGILAGHELTHGFDDTGSQYDADGELRQWWSNGTRTEFNKKTECFEHQYGSICDEEANMTLNGKNTVGENIADNGGLRTAFLAYQKLLNEDCERKETRLQGLEELSGEKLFFIANGMPISSFRLSLRTDVSF